MILFEADWSNLADWSLGPGWQVSIDGKALVCDGRGPRTDATLRLDFGNVTDYVVETEAASLGAGNSPQFGFFARREALGGYWAGHDTIVVPIGEVWFVVPDGDDFDPASLHWSVGASFPIATSVFDEETTAFEDLLDNEFHTYRLEVEGTSICLLRDGQVLVAAHDARFRQPGTVGFYSADFHQMIVRSFNVLSV